MNNIYIENDMLKSENEFLKRFLYSILKNHLSGNPYQIDDFRYFLARTAHKTKDKKFVELASKYPGKILRK